MGRIHHMNGKPSNTHFRLVFQVSKNRAAKHGGTQLIHTTRSHHTAWHIKCKHNLTQIANVSGDDVINIFFQHTLKGGWISRIALHINMIASKHIELTIC